MAILPVYSAIAFYGLYLRVMQYGWTIGRVWGLLIWLLVALVSMLLVNSPLLDLRKIARPGYLALQELKTEISDVHPEPVTQIDNLYRPHDESNEPPDLETFTSQLIVWPAVADDEISEYVFIEHMDSWGRTEGYLEYLL